MKVHRLQLARGVHPKMLELVRAWSAEGLFEIAVAKHGGLRADESTQTILSGSGMSAASSLKQTPHGRGAALDLVPLSFLDHTPSNFGGNAKRWTAWNDLPEKIKNQFLVIGTFSEKRGFKWGGRWLGRSYPNGDQPHHELPNWGALPFPPPAYAFPPDLEELIK